jgi:hypothetical protein
MDWQKGLYIFKIYIPAAMTNSIPRNTIWPTEFLETPLLHYSDNRFCISVISPLLVNNQFCHLQSI